MKKQLLPWFAILLILATGILHYITAAEEYSEARYMGILFFANFIGSLIAAVGIARQKMWGWGLGGLIAAGSILGYIQSRTVGMPGMEIEGWYDPIGIPALIVESLFLFTFALVRPWSAPVIRETASSSFNRAGARHVSLTASALLGSVSFFSLMKVVQVYQAGKDVCGLSLAHTEVLLQSPAGLKVLSIGSVFIVICLLSLFAAYGVWRRRFWAGWATGLIVPFALFLGNTQSRIAGVPEIAVTDWHDPAGIALVFGILFVVIFFISKPWQDTLKENVPAAQNAIRQPVLLASLAGLVITVGMVSYQLGARAAPAHPLPATVISNDMLEQEYGIRLTLVGVTAAGGMVDVRYRVVDPLKAAKLIDPNEGGIMPMIYVGNGDIMLMPDMHMREQKLVAGRVYFTLIPNTQNVVKRGTVVTVVFGNVAVEPTLAQ
jgi:hypothetical protein